MRKPCLKYHSQKNPNNKKLETELHYFRNNRHRMQYALALKSNYPIGSGVTEATCKVSVQPYQSSRTDLT